MTKPNPDRIATTRVELALAQERARRLREEANVVRRRSREIGEMLFRLPGGENWVRRPD